MASEVSVENLNSLAQLADKVALELVFAEAGKDNGLLPINHLVGQMEELAAASRDDELRIALALARQWIENVFVGSAAFDAETLQRLGQWTQWLQDFVSARRNGQSLPLPAFASAMPVATVAANAPPDSNRA